MTPLSFILLFYFKLFSLEFFVIENKIQVSPLARSPLHPHFTSLIIKDK